MANEFDVIEAGERDGRRRWIGLAVVLALLLIPAVSLLTSRDPVAAPADVDPAPADPAAAEVTTRPMPAPIRSLTRIDAPPNNLVIAATAKGGDEVLPVVFPDGTRAEVRYPAELNLDELGSRPFQGMWVDGRHRQLIAPYGGEVEITRGGEPIRNYAPNVTLWPRQAGAYGQVLLFSFDKWRLAMYDRGQGLTFDQRVTVAENLKGEVTEEGYLVLSGGEGVRLANAGEIERGEPVGPQLWFGGGAGKTVMLAPTPTCGKEFRPPAEVEGRRQWSDMACRGNVLVVASGPEEFREEAVKSIRVTLK